MVVEETVSVWCTCQFAAQHFWVNAMSVPSVGFLKHAHRHLFHVRAEVQVPSCIQDKDRAIEFITLRNQVDNFVKSQYAGKTHGKSCETFAREISNFVRMQFLTKAREPVPPGLYADLEPAPSVTEMTLRLTSLVPVITVTVSEDGENGATVVSRYHPSEKV